MSLVMHELETYCPVCGAKHECATNASGTRAPKDGDITICIKCGSMLVFCLGSLIKPSPADALAIEKNIDAQQVRRAWERVVRGSTN